MLKSFVDEIKTFEVNEDLKFDVVEIAPDVKIVIVDNFYKNPEMVRNLALQIPPSVNKRILNSLPVGPTSGRINVFYMQDQLGPHYDDIIKQVWPETYSHYEKDYFLDSFRDATFVVNVMTSENLPPRVPHTDTTDKRIFASTIFLNTPEECQGGIAFYKFGGNFYNIECPSTIDVAKKIKPDHFVTDNEGDWEMAYLADMAWNRMVLYPAACHHSAYIKKGWFTGDTYRMNQMFFI